MDFFQKLKPHTRPRQAPPTTSLMFINTVIIVLTKYQKALNQRIHKYSDSFFSFEVSRMSQSRVTKLTLLQNWIRQLNQSLFG